MLSAVFWVLMFIALVAAAMYVREQVRDNRGLRAWYERDIRGRLDLIKKIVVYGTLVLWAGIWLVTRGEDRADVGSVLKDYSNSWSKPEQQTPDATIKE